MQEYLKKFIKVIFVLWFVMLSCKFNNEKINNSDNKSSEEYSNIVKDEVEISAPNYSTCEKKGYFKEIDKLVLDTTSYLTEKFEIIFGECFLNHDYIKVEFVSDSLFSELNKQFSKSISLKVIDDYTLLLDLIKKGEINLRKESLKFVKKSEDLEFYALEFRNSLKDTISYDPQQFFIRFMGYLPVIDCFWFQVQDHGSYDFVIDLKNGEKSNFVPVSSPDTSYYYQLNTDLSYADGQNIIMVLGKDIHKPFIDIGYEYYPYFSQDYVAQVGIDSVFWIKNNEFAFKFYHILKVSQLNQDTLYYKNLKVKAILNAP